MIKIKAWVDRLPGFAILEALFTAAALVLTAVTVGPLAGQKIGLDGNAALAAGWAIAIVYDLVWVASIRYSGMAIQQRSAIGMIVMFGISLAALAVSVVVLLKLGHAQAFAGVPVAAAVFMGVRLFVDNVLADPTTAARIAERSAEDRNARALAASNARHLASEAHTEVLDETAGHLAELRRQIARAEVLTEAQKKISKARADAEATLEKVDKDHGEKAAAFLKRELLTVGSRTMVTAGGHTSPELDGHTVVTQVIPEIEGVTKSPVTLDESDTIEPLEQAFVEDAMTLQELADAAGIDLPQPGVTLTDEELAVVLRWLRYTMEPPRSYRQAQDAFRKAGFRAREERVRRIWGEIETLEAEAVPA